MAGRTGKEVDRDPSTLTVTGRAEIRVAPDEATVVLGIIRQEALAEQSQTRVNRAAQQILKAVEHLGVEPEQLQTSELRLVPVYSRRKANAGEEPRIIAYRASYNVLVRVKDLSLVGPVVDAALRVGANRLNGVRFGLGNDLPARERALRQAVKEASRKAEVIAETLGVQLIELIEVKEMDGIVAPRAHAARSSMAAQAEMATPIAPGQLTVTASVQVRYRVQK